MATKQASQSEGQQCIKRLRSRLDRWELPHLRELAARLSSELEEALARAYRAERDADMWRDQVYELTNELPADVSFGMTMDGNLHLLQGGAA
jgi:hypothetical protein